MLAGGGTVVFADDLYHLYAAQMNGSGMVEWDTRSECVHATARSPAGPFVLRDVALPVWCHGPQIIQHPASQTLLLFHVGGGVPSCHHCGGHSHNPNPNGTATRGQLFMHHSRSPDGPWLPATTSPPGKGCNMPCGAFHPNGTLFVICGNGHKMTHTIDATTPPWEAEWTEPVKLSPQGEHGEWEGTSQLEGHLFCSV